jgi:LDH2 family malate/lactate/ureidoglycolate dehydrogenase
VPTVHAETLAALIQDVLAAAGAPTETAEIVAGSLVLSNLKGVDSHGVVRVAQYVREIGTGRIDPLARPVVDDRGAAIVLDGRWCFGQIAAREATRLAVERSAQTAVAVATVFSVQHVGRLGEYVETAAASGRVALACTNTGPAGGRVAPHGGREPSLGTNPFAYAVPAGANPAVVADFATSAAAEGRLRLARQTGSPVPEGWIVDAEGKPTTDPNDYYAGGALLPAGGHKGYALGLLAELLGGVLAGAGCASAGDEPGNGVVMVLLDPACWRPLETFLAGVDRVVDAVCRVPPAPGFRRVQLPGGPEAEVEAERRVRGIPVPEATWREFAETARSLGVEHESMR